MSGSVRPEAYAKNPIHLFEGHSQKAGARVRYFRVLGKSVFKAPISESHNMMNKALQAPMDPGFDKLRASTMPRSYETGNSL